MNIYRLLSTNKKNKKLILQIIKNYLENHDCMNFGKSIKVKKLNISWLVKNKIRVINADLDFEKSSVIDLGIITIEHFNIINTPYFKSPHNKKFEEFLISNIKNEFRKKTIKNIFNSL